MWSKQLGMLLDESRRLVMIIPTVQNAETSTNDDDDNNVNIDREIRYA